MIKAQPDKWIRKAISTAINNIVVDGMQIPCYDTRVTRDSNSDIPSHYVLMASQSNEVDKGNKCEDFWESQILLDIYTSYEVPGNTGTRVLADDILEAVKDATNSLVLDVASGLTIINQSDSFPNDLSITTKRENIFRKFLRLELKIK